MKLLYKFEINKLMKKICIMIIKYFYKGKLYMENKVKSIVAKYIKLYRGRGPLYIKVISKDNLLEIEIKGVLSTVGQYLVKRGAAHLPEMAWNELKDMFLDSVIDELCSEVGKKCSLVLEKTDFHNDTRNMVIKVDN